MYVISIDTGFLELLSLLFLTDSTCLGFEIDPSYRSFLPYSGSHLFVDGYTNIAVQVYLSIMICPFIDHLSR